MSRVPLSLSSRCGRVDEDELLVARGQIHLLLENFQFIAAVPVQSDLADAQDVRTVQKLRDNFNDLRRQLQVLGLLGIEAEPGEVGQAEFGGAPRLVFGQLAKIIVKTLDRAAVKPRPKGRLANRLAAGGGQATNNRPWSG